MVAKQVWTFAIYITELKKSFEFGEQIHITAVVTCQRIKENIFKLHVRHCYNEQNALSSPRPTLDVHTKSLML